MLVYFPFAMTSIWPNPQDFVFSLIFQHLKMVKMPIYIDYYSYHYEPKLLPMANIHFRLNVF